MELRGSRSGPKFFAGFVTLGLALVSFFGVAVSQPERREEPDRVIAVGFPAGAARVYVSVWGEHLDPFKRHNATDVDEDVQAVFRVHVLLQQSEESTRSPASVYFVGVSASEIYRCSNLDDSAVPATISESSFDAAIPVAQRAITDYFTDNERHGDVIDSPSWDAGQSLTPDAATAAARAVPVTMVTTSGTTSSTATLEGETRRVAQQRFSCDLAADLAWAVDRPWLLPERRINYTFPALSVRSEGVPERTYVEVSSQHLFNREIGAVTMRSELSQQTRDSGQLYISTASSGTEQGEAGQQLRRVVAEFTPSTWTVVSQIALFVSGVLASLGVSLMVAALTPMRLRTTSR